MHKFSGENKIAQKFDIADGLKYVPYPCIRGIFKLV